MELLKEINKSQGTTFLVVTHDLNVARQTLPCGGHVRRQDRA